VVEDNPGDARLRASWVKVDFRCYATIPRCRLRGSLPRVWGI